MIRALGAHQGAAPSPPRIQPRSGGEPTPGDGPRDGGIAGLEVTAADDDPGYMSRKIRKFRTDKFDT